jgi:TatD DNase family protein
MLQELPKIMSARGLVDTHAHLMDAAFEADRVAVLGRAADAEVAAVVIVGYDLPSSRAALDLARDLPNARAAVGIHPNSAAQASAADFDALADLARDRLVVAIGETGLDNFRDFTPPVRQREALDWHLELAADLDLPVIVHNRQADAAIRPVLASYALGRSTPGVLHCFSSTDPAYLDAMLDAGFAISFAGPLTYKNASDLRAIASRVPLDRLLVETDCPYLPPASRRGQRNEPAFIRETADCLAGLHQIPWQSLLDQLWRNTERVFPALVDATPLVI